MMIKDDLQWFCACLNRVFLSLFLSRCTNLCLISSNVTRKQCLLCVCVASVGFSLSVYVFAVVVWRQNQLLPSNWLTLNCDLNHDQNDHNKSQWVDNRCENQAWSSNQDVTYSLLRQIRESTSTIKWMQRTHIWKKVLFSCEIRQICVKITNTPGKVHL